VLTLSSFQHFGMGDSTSPFFYKKGGLFARLKKSFVL
jgi:hypothetical protein